MAKIERKRSMFFGSWTGAPIDAAAVATVLIGEAITGVTIIAETFGSKVKNSGEYEFVYSGDGKAWRMDGSVVDSTQYGMTVDGTPADGDRVLVVFTAASSGWEALGKDNDSLVKELNPDTDSTKNVLGESGFKHSGYKPSVDLDPYYMDPSRIMYKHLLECAMEEKYSEDDLLGYFAEAFFTSVDAEAGTMSGYCYQRRAWFVPKSTGGDTSGYSIPYTINPVGPMTKRKIVYDMSTNQATITDFGA